MFAAGRIHGDAELADVGRRVRRGVEAVVAGIGAAGGDAIDRDGLAGAGVLVGEGRRGVAEGDHITRHQACRAQRRIAAAVLPS